MEKRKNQDIQKIWCKLGAALLMLAMMVVICPMSAKAGEVTTGKLGNNGGITWTYDAETKTLTLTGEDSGLSGEYNFGKYCYTSKLINIANGKFRHIVLENCIIKDSMDHMFSQLCDVQSITFTNVDTSTVTSMKNMFSACHSLTSLDLRSFDTTNVTSMYMMFSACINLTSLDVSSFDTRNVTDMSTMFYNCGKLTNLDLSSFNTENVTSMNEMFCYCFSLKDLDINNFDTRNVTDMTSMFSCCAHLESLNISNFDTEKVTSMCDMFSGCSNLTNLNLSNLDARNVTNMSSMFNGCSQLTDLNLKGFNAPKVTGINLMFYNCPKLSELDLSGFDLSNITSPFDVFKYDRKIKTIKTPKSIPNNVTLALADIYLDGQGTKYTVLSKDNCNTTLVREPSPFADVVENSWQYEYVKFALNNNLMKGKDTDANGNIIFDPDTEMTRAEFVQTLYNKEGKPQVTYTNRFPDVSAEMWYTNAILWAAENKIVAGKGDGNFDVNGKITRQEMATILCNYAKYKGYNTGWREELTDYTDTSTISSWAVENMKWAVAVEVMKGKGDRLAPLDNATRAECATMLCNFIYFHGN